MIGVHLAISLLDQIGQSLRSAPFLAREVAAEIEQAFARARVIERLVSAALSLSMIGLGVPLGANSAFHAEA